MQEFGLKDKHYDLSFKEMMIHKVNGFDFVVADLMPRLLKLEASLKDDELKARAAMEKNQDNEVMIEAKKDDLKDSGKLYDVTVSRVLKGSACALIAYGISVSLYNFFSYSGFF
ncbi:hypothetical protein [Klebsiella variicola]|nr:hypothetical protein [Klebsiella variicola]